MKKYVASIGALFFLLFVFTVKGEDCPNPTLSIGGTTSQFFHITLFDNPEGIASGVGWGWSITYSFNDAVVLIDQDGNVVPSSQNTQVIAGKYTIKIVGSGEYYNCGGGYDSPPITFGDEPVYYFNTPANTPYANKQPGPKAPQVHDSIYCSNSQLTVSDNGNQIATSPSSGMTEFSFDLDEGTHNIEVSRAVDCKYSYYVENNYPKNAMIKVGPPGKPCPGCDGDYGILTPPYTATSLTDKSSTSPPLTYSLNVDTIGDTCKKGCDSDFICCRNKCMNSNDGICKDINGDGIPDWIPFK